VADGATEGHFKAHLRTIKYVIGTEYLVLRLKPKFHNDSFYMERIYDNPYAGDLDTRINIYGYILYLCVATVPWSSKAGKSVTLSSTEAHL
jgi:hypothetical protein